MPTVLTIPTVEAAELPTPEALPLPIKLFDIEALIKSEAAKNGINYELFYKTLKCESGNFQDVTIQSQYKRLDGTQERSYGIAQFNIDAHPDITIASATDPLWAIPYAAREFKRNPNQWSCYRLILK